MNKGTNNDQNHLKTLANQFLVMSQKGTVCFYEETVIEELVDYFLQEKKERTALELADWGIQIYPYSSNMLYLKSEVLYQQKKYAQALYHLDSAISLDPRDVNSFLLKARILIEMERYDQATETLCALDEGNVEGNAMSNVHLCFASIYENLDRHHDMFDSLCRAIRMDWDNEEVLERLGLCTEFCLKHQEHIDFLQEYLDERPYSSIAWFNLGHSYWYLKDLENAASAFEYAFIIDKFFHQAYLDCADVLIAMNAHEVALTCYNDALENWPKDGELYAGKGTCLFMTQQYEKALMAYKEATHYTPNSSEGFYGKGICYMELGAPIQALDAFSKAATIDDRKEEYAAALGEAHYQIGNTKAAAISFDRAIELAPEVSQHWIRNITFLMDENRFEDALENIHAAFENTFGTELLYCHAAYCFRVGQRVEGISILQRAIDEDYDMHNSFLDLCPGLSEDNEVIAVIAASRP